MDAFVFVYTNKSKKEADTTLNQILPIWNAKYRQNPVTGHTCVNSNENHDTLKSVSLKSLTAGCRRRLSVMHVRKQEEKS